MATRVQSTGNFVSTSGTSILLPYGSNVTAGNLLVCHMAVAIVAASTFSVTDSQGNTWQAATSQAVSSAWKIQTFWTKAGSTGANSVTAARSTPASTDERVISISEFAPTAGNVWPTNPVDGANTANGSTANPSLNVTVAAGAALLTGGVATTGSATPGAGFLTLANQDGNEFEYDLTPGSGSVAVPFVAAASTWAACAASFIEASGVTPANTGYGDGSYGVGSYGIRLDTSTPITASDSGAVTDSAAIAVTLASSESITATDAAAVAAALTVSEPISHSDASTSINATLAGADALTHSEATTADATVAAAESHTQTETGALANTADVTDPATQGDASGIAASLAAADSETSTDASAKTELYSAADSGALSDAGGVAAAVAVSEAGAVSDAAAVAAAVIAADAWAAADSAAVQSTNAVPVTDSATQSDAGAVAAAVAAQETAAFSEAVSIAAAVAGTDAHVMSESVLSGEFADKLVSDAGLLSEAAALANAVAASDAWATADAISSLAATLAATDSGALLDAAAVLANVAALESGALTDIGSVTQGSTSISASDAVTLMESAAMATALGVSDSWLMGSFGSGYYASVVLPDSPTAYYRMNESSGTTFADEQATYPATMRGTPFPQLGVASPIATDAGGVAARFTGSTNGTTNGAGADVAVPLSGSLSVTLEAWVKFATSESFGPIIDLSDSSQPITNGRQYALNAASGGLRYYVRSSAASEAPATTPQNWNDGLWHHVVGVYDGATRKIYVDGTQRASQTGAVSTSFAGTANVRIGYDARGGSPNRYASDMSIDEMAVYIGTALSGARITAHYNAGRLAVLPELATVDVLTVKTALDSWVLSEATNVLQGIPAPMLRLPLTSAIVVRSAVAAVVARLAAAAVQARSGSTVVHPPALDADVADTLGSTVITPKSAATQVNPRSSKVNNVNYG